MGKINVLKPSVYNQISAGEVVERPYSVVKELVENAIDAGSEEIKIEIENGGTTLIRVTDDGFGMDKEDLSRAFLPHATSKIKVAEDLSVIHTLGFRGEALSSIGAVSRATIASFYAGGDGGYEITSEGGVLSEITESTVSIGTTVTVRDLFFNTPARAKFLKTERGEEADVSNTVSRLILANPTVAFTYIANGKTVYRSFGGSAEEALVAVYGKEAVENSFYIDTVKHGLHIYGYLGKHFYTKGNRTYQTVVLNGRYIVNQTIASAVHNAYQSYLMKRNYPFYLLYIDLPGEFVDVNVHPNKADVRFQDNQVVYGSLYSVVSAVLDGSTAAIDIVKNLPKGSALAETGPAETENPASGGAENGLHKAESGLKPGGFAASGASFAAPKSEKKDKNENLSLDEIYRKIKQENDAEGAKVAAADYFKSGSYGFGGADKSAGNGAQKADGALSEAEKDAIFAENKRFIEQAEAAVKFAGGNSAAGDRGNGAAGAAMTAEKSALLGGALRSAVEKQENIRDAAVKGENAPSFAANSQNAAADPGESRGLQASGAIEQKEDLQEDGAAKIANAAVFGASSGQIEKNSGVSPLATMTYIGQAFKTYLFFECDETLYLVDQHAVHERMIYDDLLEKVKNRRLVMQPMLIPYVLSVNPQEDAFLRENLDSFREIGVEIEEFGGRTYKISALASDLLGLDPEAFLRSALSGLETLRREISAKEILKEKLMQTACKAAIKAGFSISDGEIVRIREKLSQNPGLTCPHGRPVAVKITKTELEKWFKRLV